MDYTNIKEKMEKTTADVAWEQAVRNKQQFKRRR